MDLQVECLQDDRIGSSIDELEFDRWNAICWKMLSLNKHRMKESEDPESTRDFKIISGRVSDVRKRVSESGFERADALRVRVFA